MGGPAGSAADAVNAFAGIDGKLLVITGLIVALLLLLTYRSPVLWLFPLLSVGLAVSWAQGAAYTLAELGFTVNGMTVGILTVLVFGAGTDYALLLMARYREELHLHEDHHEAMAVALGRAAPAIAVSGFTVVLALLCLLVAQLSDIAALGPACAAGIVCALAAQLLFLPALLAAVGRRALWPFVPHPGQGGPQETGAFWRLSRALVRHPRRSWVSLALVLGVCCFGLIAYQGGVNQQNGFRGTVGSVEAQAILVANFPAGETAPASMLVTKAAAASAAKVARSTPGVSGSSAPTVLGTMRLVDISLAAPPTSAAAARAVVALRERLAAAGDHALIGGETATNVDLDAAAGHDRGLIIPIVLAVVLVMLALLLRSLVAPAVLVASVLLSYLASLGVSSVVFRGLFGFPGFDAVRAHIRLCVPSRPGGRLQHLPHGPGARRGGKRSGTGSTKRPRRYRRGHNVRRRRPGGHVCRPRRPPPHRAYGSGVPGGVRGPGRHHPGAFGTGTGARHGHRPQVVVAELSGRPEPDVGLAGSVGRRQPAL